MAYMNLSYTHIIQLYTYAVHSIIMYTMLNQEFTVSSRLHNNIPANIFLPHKHDLHAQQNRNLNTLTAARCLSQLCLPVL